MGGTRGSRSKQEHFVIVVHMTHQPQSCLSGPACFGPLRQLFFMWFGGWHQKLLLKDIAGTSNGHGEVEVAKCGVCKCLFRKCHRVVRCKDTRKSLIGSCGESSSPWVEGSILWRVPQGDPYVMSLCAGGWAIWERWEGLVSSPSCFWTAQHGSCFSLAPEARMAHTGTRCRA